MLSGSAFSCYCGPCYCVPACAQHAPGPKTLLEGWLHASGRSGSCRPCGVPLGQVPVGFPVGSPVGFLWGPCGVPLGQVPASGTSTEHEAELLPQQGSEQVAPALGGMGTCCTPARGQISRCPHPGDATAGMPRQRCADFSSSSYCPEKGKKKIQRRANERAAASRGG